MKSNLSGMATFIAWPMKQYLKRRKASWLTGIERTISERNLHPGDWNEQLDENGD